MAGALVWFRQDLRLADNPALEAALRHGGPLLCLYLWSPDEEFPWAPGAASRSWLHHSLKALEVSLKEKGQKLVILKGKSHLVLPALIRKYKINAVFWNQIYEPLAHKRDAKLKKLLEAQGHTVQEFSSLLFLENVGKPYQVFTPFWKECLQHAVPKPISSPRHLPPPPHISGEPLSALKLLPKPHWDRGFYPFWTPGEQGARRRLAQFLKKGLSSYFKTRDFPAFSEGSSHLSPHLHFGELSPRQIWYAVQGKKGGDAFLRQLGWREFAYQLLVYFPEIPSHPLRQKFADFPWKNQTEWLRLWQQGETGYPIVDAGMRELWKTGTMHNRVRMIVASFLTKDLLIPWQRGADWFWDTLVDADLANNTLGWQWTAGCGADAVPFFRIFNPVTQGEKFDPKGDYIRTYVPELARLPDRWIHQPWNAPQEYRQELSYPDPIVDHDAARRKALELFKRWKR